MYNSAKQGYKTGLAAMYLSDLLLNARNLTPQYKCWIILQQLALKTGLT